MNTTIIRTDKKTARKLLAHVTGKLNRPTRPVMMFGSVNENEYCVSGCSAGEFASSVRRCKFEIVCVK